MPLYEISDRQLRSISQTTFSREGIQERRDLQEMLKNNIGIVAPDAMVLAIEYGKWEDSRRRIDILCLDKAARLVVVELKRSEDGGHMDLQAIRYAAMVARMTFAEAAAAYAEFKDIPEVEAQAAILDFLDWDNPQEGDFAEDVSIILISSEFSKEITTAVMWLSEFDIDLTCIRLVPYLNDGKILVDIQKVFPLPEAQDYQIKIREKEREERVIREQNRDLTRYDLTIGKKVLSHLPKRDLVFYVVQEAIKRGFKPSALINKMRFWIVVDGKRTEGDFIAVAGKSRIDGCSSSSPRRFYTSDEDLFHVDGKTYALSKQWGRHTIPTVNHIITSCKLSDVTYAPSKASE